MSAKGLLTVSKDGEVIKKLEFDSEIVLGRGDECDLKLDDRAISRKHAVIRPIPNGVQIEKRSLFSELKVNGVDLTSCILKDGDYFEVGPYSIQMSGQGGAATPATHMTAVKAEPDMDDALKAPVIDMGTKAKTRDKVDEQNSEEPLESSDNDFLNLDSLESETSEKEEGSDIAIDGGIEEQSQLSGPVPTQEIDPLESRALDAEFGGGASGEDALEIEPSGEISQAFGDDLPLEVEPSVADSQSKLSQSGNIELSEDEGSSPISVGEGSMSLSPPDGASGEIGEGEEVKPFEIDMTSDNIGGFGDTKSEFGSTDAKTRLGEPQLELGLEFPEGSANVTAVEIGDKEIFIGRGKKCEVVLNDKKASRKHISIKRQGVAVILNDLDSANGTYVNDVKVTSKRLSGNDRIRIGNVEFKFVAKREAQSSVSGSIGTNSEYSESVELGSSSIGQYMPQTPGANTKPLMMGVPGIPGHMGTKTIPQAGGVPGVPTQQASAMGAKLKGNARKKILYVLVVVMLAWTMFEKEIDEFLGVGQGRKTASVKGKKAGKTAPTFKNLSPEKQRYVKSQYDLSLDLYKNGEYEKAVFEIRKIFKLIPNYLDAKDIESYAIEAQKRVEANNEEKRRKEEEEARKRRVVELTQKAKQLMDAKKYDSVGELFVQILALDPENRSVAKWQQKIDEYKEDQERLARERRVQAQINKNALDIYNAAVKFQQQRRWIDAIRKFKDAKSTGLDDKRLISKIEQGIAFAKQQIADELRPVLEEAKTLEQEGNVVGAFKLYEKAMKIDPDNPAGQEGIDRIEGVLDEKAKFAYTEAVIAESYSDFALAKKKFLEVLDIVPEENKYFQRATRKLQRYTVIQGPKRALSSEDDEGGFDE